MNEQEMEGILKGRAIPRDLFVNESIAHYLVRKFNELEQELAAERARAVKPIYQLLDDGKWYETEKYLYDEAVERDDVCRIVYTAPPLPVVPDIGALRLRFEAAERESEIEFNLHKFGIGYADAATQHRWEQWLACRAAMLNHSGDTSKMAVGNSPVIDIDPASGPDRTVEVRYFAPPGYVIVPIVPTEDMIINGFESEPDPHFSNEKEWEEYEALSGCQRAARRAELCWAAMIKAAPKQENI